MKRPLGLCPLLSSPGFGLPYKEKSRKRPFLGLSEDLKMTETLQRIDLTIIFATRTSRKTLENRFSKNIYKIYSSAKRSVNLPLYIFGRQTMVYGKKRQGEQALKTQDGQSTALSSSPMISRLLRTSKPLFIRR